MSDEVPTIGFWCEHRGKDENGDPIAIEMWEEEKDHPRYWMCRVCGSRFPVIGDTDKWAPVFVEYEEPFG
jgi:hypothetical protein